MRNIVVAYDNERAIGRNGELLWKKGEMRGDMKHFRELTTGSTVIMGRKTLDSIGIALPNRQNIVLSRSKSVQVSNIEIASSLEDAYALTGGYEEVFIIGGGEIYRQALANVERIYATEVDATIDRADTYFPDLDLSWHKTEECKFPADDKNAYPYNFVIYEKK